MAKSFFRRFTKKTFIIFNLAFAILFILSCNVWQFNPERYWFLGLLNVASLYLLIVLLVFFCASLFAKPVLCFISLLSFAICANPLKQLIAFNISAKFSSQKSANNLRVMSWNVALFNILGHKTNPEVKTKMLNTILNYNPDIACFQEVAATNEKPAAINYIKTMKDYMQMPYSFFSYNPTLDFDGEHHFGILVFSKYPIIKKQTISQPPHNYNSIFQYIDIVKNGDTIRIFNVHLQSLKFDKENMAFAENPDLDKKEDLKKSLSIVTKFKEGFIKRKIQSDNIKQELNESPYPTILCGDFNDVPNSYAYHRIGQGLNNAFVEKGKYIGRTFSGISPTLRIDNIFADKKFNIIQFETINKKMSDHYAIVADMQLGNK